MMLREFEGFDRSDPVFGRVGRKVPERRMA